MIVVVGLSHHAAPIEVREQLALSKRAAAEFTAHLMSEQAVREAMVLSTCNRVEVIAACAGGAQDGLEAVAALCAERLAQRAPEARGYLYRHVGAAAVHHLFRVAASLDSMVLGEPQILGQLKQAFDAACKQGTVGSALYRAVPRALRAAKRVRTETSIGSGQVSVPSVAVDLARQIFSELSGTTALLIGSGDMGRTVARLLGGQGAAIQVLGRTPASVQKVADEVGGEPRTFADLKASLTEADVVITSTSAPDYIVTRELVAAVRRSRRGRDLFFIDLAVPRDVEPEVGSLDCAFLYNVDDFSKIVAESMANRQREREVAERIVARAAEGYERWAEAEQVTPVIKALRARFSQIMQTELEKSLRGRLRELGEPEREALQRMMDAALNKMLHEPSQALRALASERGKEPEGFVDSAVEVLKALFALEGDAEDAPRASARGTSTPAAAMPLVEAPLGPESGAHPKPGSQEDAASTGSR